MFNIKTYHKGITILSLLPLVITVIFSFFNVKTSFQAISDTKFLNDNINTLIIKFYEVQYLQDERSNALLYLLTKDDSIKDKLLEAFEIENVYFNTIDMNLNIQLKNLRDSISNSTISYENILYSYTNIITSYITYIDYNTKQQTLEQDLLKTIDNYKLFLKISENYSFTKTFIKLYSFDKSETTKNNIIYSNKLNDFYINMLYKNLLLQDDKIKELLGKDFLESCNALVSNEEGLNNKSIEIIENLNSILMTINNYLVNDIETISKNVYQKLLMELIVLILFSVLVSIISLIFGNILRKKILKHISNNFKELQDKNNEISKLYTTVDKYVILSTTDKKGNITHASEAFCKISGYKKEELIGKPHNIVRHPDMPQEIFNDLWKHIKTGSSWQGEIKNLKKDGSYYIVNAFISPIYDDNNNIIGYTGIRENITEQKKSLELHKKVNDLLNNANQGFLSFAYDLAIQKGYSLQSSSILGSNDLEGKKITDILFCDDLESKDTFEFGIQTLFETNDNNSKELILSLLPHEYSKNGITFTINYKLIDKNTCMIILEDISEKKALESKIEYDSKIHKMIVSVATRKQEFLDLVKQFINFITNFESMINVLDDKQSNLSIIIEQLHTYKGLFAQEELLHTTHAIHELESELQKLRINKQIFYHDTLNSLVDNSSLIQMIKDSNLYIELEKDLKIITNILGNDFMDSRKIVTIDEEDFEQFDKKLLNIINQNSPMSELLNNLRLHYLNLNQKSLKQLLDIYPKRVKIVAERLKKELYDFSIQGNPSLMVDNAYIPFINSLVHVFRNMIDHGIEDMNTRVSLGKNPKGRIECSFSSIDNNIEIIISDDGYGIDIHKITNKAFALKMISEEEIKYLTKTEILNLIFSNDFSTKDETDILSGRGVGLFAVKNELDKIGGKVEVNSIKGAGTKFIFNIPYNRCILPVSIKTEDIHQVTNKTILNKFERFFIDSLKIKNLEIIETNNFEFFKIHSNIQLVCNQETIIFTLCIDDNFKNNLANFFIPDLDNSTIHSQLLSNEILDETMNIVIGNTISYLPEQYRNCELSTPMYFDKDLLISMSEQNIYFNYNIYTNLGNLFISIIYLAKE